MMNRLTKNIPNIITLCNLLSGCIAIYMTFNLDNIVWGLPGLYWAWIWIGAAAIFDFCDGAAARLLKAYSDIGRELDSLSDLVSFGVAPGMMMLNMMLAYSHTPWLCWIALLIPAMGAWRLAKFNCDTRQTTSFRGLPIPANAIFWIGMTGWIERYAYPGTVVMAVLIFLVCRLMISEMPMFSLKFKNFDFHENFRRYALLLATIAFVVVWGISGLVWVIVLYIMISALSRRSIEA